MRTTAPLLRALIRLSDAVGNAATPQDIYEASLAGLREALGIERAAILLFDQDRVMRFKASIGLSEEFRRALEGHTPWFPGRPAPEPIVVSDVRRNSDLAPFQEALAKERIGALAFIPLVSRRRVIGKFALYTAEPRPFSEVEVSAATTIGYQIGFALERMRTAAEVEESHERALAALSHESDVRRRLTTLTGGSQRLLTTLDVDSMTEHVVALAREVVSADGYAVWRKGAREWRIVSSAGLSEDFVKITLPTGSPIRFDTPTVIEDVATSRILEPRLPALELEGIRSLITVPLPIRKQAAASIVFYYRTHHRPADIDVQVAVAVGHLAAAAISNAELYAEQQRAADRAAFMAEVSALLTSFDYEETLRKLARASVPRLADWCTIDLLMPPGALQRVAAAHVNPRHEQQLASLLERFPSSIESPGITFRVVRSGVPELFESIDGELLGALVHDKELLGILRELDPASAVIVPLSIGPRTFGAMLFARGRDRRAFSHDDLQFAGELARRVALSVENGRLFAEAQEASRLKDEFLAALSHELRTPLNAILGWASMLRTPMGQRQIERGLKVIQRNAEAQARLVNDLLDASRISRGRMKLELSDIDIRKPALAAVETVRPMALAKNVDLQTSVPEVPCTVRGDASRLQQVFWNLLSNAVKFTEAGGRIQVIVESDGRVVVIRVIDSGIGIPPEFLPMVFERFRQADASTTRAHGGLGLGLTLARQITEMHGGQISASSEGRGKGTEFTVRLPLCAGAAQGDLAHRPSEMSVPGLESCRVLVVDDDPDSLEMVDTLLKSHGGSVAVASSADEALKLLPEVRPHIVISDIAMPDRDGYWLIQRVREFDAAEGTATAAIAVTAFAGSDARQRSLAAGFQAHLAKPIDGFELIRTVHRLMSVASR